MSFNSLPDTASLGRHNLVLDLRNQLHLRVDILTTRLFRLRFSANGAWTESALNRYRIYLPQSAKPSFTVSESDQAVRIVTADAQLEISRADGRFGLFNAAGESLARQAQTSLVGSGFRLTWQLTPGERLYGLGDVSRENIMRRGESYEIWVRNVKSYIPIPVLLSSRNWGLLVNTTWRHQIDVGKTDPDQLVCSAAQSNADFYVFTGDGYAGLLDEYTAFTGRPALLPIWAYALTYVCNQQVDAFNMINEALTFRREDIPCDVIGLEPGWMSKNYDYSTEKAWHPERFFIPRWSPIGPQTFTGALERLGYKLSLWLCCDHDLSVLEEQQLECADAAVAPPKDAALSAAVEDDDDDDFEKDEHFRPTAKKPSEQPAAPQAEPPSDLPESWFDHLKKFVDQGARAFKLDGANQVIEHPDRAWGNGMNDEQMHNLYPLIYGKQMAKGFEEHTDQRAMVYSAGGYTGIQQYVATWAGDTGGGPKPLASMLNHGFSGHSNHSCDMDVFCPGGIHFGFLQTWAQLNNWAYWRQPWLLTPAGLQMFRDYAHLRYRLLPYLYSTAAQATCSGMPVMRAMSLVYSDDPAWDDVRTQYMLGDFLLVTSYTDELRLPAGNWIDFWTGRTLTGPLLTKAEYPADRGGCLLVKEGAIIPTWAVQPHVDCGFAEEVTFLAYPGSMNTEFLLYEDDGQSLKYRDGESTVTRLECHADAVVIHPSQGDFPERPETRVAKLVIRTGARPQTVLVNDKAVREWNWDEAEGALTVTVSPWKTSEEVRVTWK